MHNASPEKWIEACTVGQLDRQLAHYYGGDEVNTWRQNYLEALHGFIEAYGGDGEVVIARCPGQMNIMGVHIDYGGMASTRLSVRGVDTLTIARAADSGRVRMGNMLRYPGEDSGKFAPIEFDLDEIAPEENVGTRQAMMDYAGKVCNQREAQSGSAMAQGWEILPQGQLVFLESYFRGRLQLRGFDALIWSNVSPSGGMSSSSALVISTAIAALGVHGLKPLEDIREEDLVDGLGTSEWMRGTRGGTADHGGMVMGRVGKLISVGVFPAKACGQAVLPDDYVAAIFDSGVPRVYDEAVKEETVIAYPLGTFLIRDVLLPQLQSEPGFEDLVADYKERIVFIRDIEEKNLGISLAGIYRLLAGLPKRTTLRQVEALAGEAGAGDAYEAMYRRDVHGKFPSIDADYAILLRRRFTYGLTEQDRVVRMLEYMNAGDMETALELTRIAHDGDLDVEVEDGELEDLRRRAERGEERARLCFLPGGYGRMTPEYDRVVRAINEYLLRQGGPTAGSVQRFGAGWGGNVGGLIRREFISGEEAEAFGRMLRQELGIEVDLEECVAIPGEGACLLEAPGN